MNAHFFPDFQVKASQSAFLEQFNDIVVDVPAEDLYYLLQTFASMALSREIKDLDFIRCVTTDLFKVRNRPILESSTWPTMWHDFNGFYL